MKIKNSFHTYAIITILCWSMSYVFTKLVLDYFSAQSLGFLRYIIASCILIIFSVIMKIKLPQTKHLFYFAVSGLTGFGLYVVIFNVGTSFVSAATSSAVISTVPVITALIASLVYKEKLKTYEWFAISLQFIGIIVLTLYDGVLTINIGVLWLLFAALLLSVYNILQRTLVKSYTAFESTTYSMLFGLLFLCIFAKGAINDLSNAPPIAIFYVLILGIFPSALAYVCWTKAFEKAEKTSSVSNYMFITPVLTSVLGFIIAKEIPEGSTLVGGGIILSGAFMFNKGGQIIKPKLNQTQRYTKA